LAAFAKVAGLAVAGVGALVLLGWIFDVQTLKSISPDWMTMKVNTAFASSWQVFRWLCSLMNQGHSLASLAGGWRATVLLVAVLTLGEYALNVDFGLDQLLKLQPEAERFPSRSDVGRHGF